MLAINTRTLSFPLYSIRSWEKELSYLSGALPFFIFSSIASFLPEQLGNSHRHSQREGQRAVWTRTAPQLHTTVESPSPSARARPPRPPDALSLPRSFCADGME